MFIVEPFITVGVETINKEIQKLPFENELHTNLLAEVTLKLPKKAKIENIPNNNTFDYSFMKIDITYELIEPNTIKITQERIQKKLIIMPEDYKQYRDEILRLKKEEQKRIVYTLDSL